MFTVKQKALVDICMWMIFSQEKKEDGDSDEEGKEGAAAAAGKPASDSDEDSESEEEEVHVVNIAVTFQENDSKFILGIIDFPVWFPFTSACMFPDLPSLFGITEGPCEINKRVFSILG